MPHLSKSRDISQKLNREFNEVISELYLRHRFSAREIVDWLKDKTGIKMTNRSIQRFLEQLGIIRSYSEAFKTAIKRGTKTYDSVRKTIKSSAFRKGISLKLRYQIFERDKGKCQLCGKTSVDDLIVIDHILPVVKHGTNDPANLRLLCRECNTGKMLAE